MAEKIIIGIGELAVAKNPAVIVTLGLGSCVGVCLRDPKKKIGGLVHVMLPRSPGGEVSKPGKYADTGIKKLVEEIEKIGGNLKNLEAKIAGGAAMFGSKSTTMGSGERKSGSSWNKTTSRRHWWQQSKKHRVQHRYRKIDG